MAQTKIIKESKDEEARAYDRRMWPIRTTFRLIGCWPLGHSENNVLAIGWRYFYQAFVLFAIMTGVMGTAVEFVLTQGQPINDRIECILTFATFFIFFLRFVVFRRHQKDLEFLFNKMRHDWLESNPEDKDVLRKKCLPVFTTVYLFFGFLTVAGLNYCFEPIMEWKFHPEDNADTDLLPYPSYYMFNYTRNEFIFTLTFAFNFYTGFIFVCTTGAASSFSLLSTIHGSAKFRIVQNNFKSFTRADWNSKAKIGNCVKLHEECIAYTEVVKRVLKYLALGQFGASTGLLCFAGFQLITMRNDDIVLPKYMTLLGAQIMILFIYSHGGERIKTESEAIGDIVHSSDDIGCFSSSDIRLISMRARKPCIVTAGKFYDLCHVSFLKVLRTSFSYFTVLLAMKDD